MTTARSAGSAGDDDSLIWMVLAYLAGPALLAYFWQQALAWMLAHQVVVPADHSPLVALPASDGVGLDAPRLLLAAAVVLGLIAILGHRMRHTIQARRLRSQQ